MYASKSKSEILSDPTISFKTTVLPKKVIRYVCARSFCNFTPSNLTLPFLNGSVFISNVASTRKRASNPLSISKL